MRRRSGQEFADTVAKEKDATKTASGVVIRTITPGAGASPTAADVVKVHYEGKLIDGTVFDSSMNRPGFSGDSGFESGRHWQLTR